MKKLLVSLVALSGAPAFADNLVICRTQAGYDKPSALLYSVKDGAFLVRSATLGGEPAQVDAPIKTKRGDLYFRSLRPEGDFIVHRKDLSFTVFGEAAGGQKGVCVVRGDSHAVARP